MINKLKPEDLPQYHDIYHMGEGSRFQYRIRLSWSGLEMENRGNGCPYSVNFEIAEIVTEFEGEYFYMTETSDGTTDFEEAEFLVRGNIKWDGCCNMNLGDEDGYIHTCDKYQMTEIGVLLGLVYDFADEKMRID